MKKQNNCYTLSCYIGNHRLCPLKDICCCICHKNKRKVGKHT